VALELDLHILTEEIVERLDDDDLIAFLVGIVEAVDDIDTTECLWHKFREVLIAQEKAALAEEKAELAEEKVDAPD
jgi:hypothetical protein